MKNIGTCSYTQNIAYGIKQINDIQSVQKFMVSTNLMLCNDMSLLYVVLGCN